MEDFTICSQVSWLENLVEQQLFSESSCSEQVKLCSGDGFSVSLPAHLLLASSKLARMTFVTGAEHQEVIIPSVQGSTLLLLAEILRSGRTSHLDKIDSMAHRLNEFNEVMELLDIPGCVSLMRVISRPGEIQSKADVQRTKLGREQLLSSHSPVVNVTKLKVLSGPVNSDRNVSKVGRRKLEVGETGADGGGGSRINCNYCEGWYRNRDSLHDHMRKSHRSEMIPCKVCGMCFVHEDTLTVHMKRHGQAGVQCDKCPAKFTRKTGLKIHLITVHSGIRHVCSHCSSTFSIKHNLKRHIRKHHKLSADMGESGDMQDDV